MRLEEEIKKSFPNYKDLADCCFNRSHDLWERPMYQKNSVFVKLKEKHGQENSKVTTRSQIIELFKKEEYYDGYLCALVWGNIGTFQNGRKNFNNAFSISEKDCKTRIGNVKLMISDDNIAGAFNSMCSKGNNYIPGLGVSFFTKILYFVGASLDNGSTPLIFDTKSLKVLTRIYKDENIQRPVRQTTRCYLDFCQKMNSIANELELPTPGHLEAFLFNCGDSLY